MKQEIQIIIYDELTTEEKKKFDDKIWKEIEEEELEIDLKEKR